MQILRIDNVQIEGITTCLPARSEDNLSRCTEIYGMEAKAISIVKAINVYSRRYFYPLLTDFAPYVYAKGTCPIAEDIASRILTLPTYYTLALDDVKEIAHNVLEIVK